MGRDEWTQFLERERRCDAAEKADVDSLIEMFQLDTRLERRISAVVAVALIPPGLVWIAIQSCWLAVGMAAHVARSSAGRSARQSWTIARRLWSAPNP